MYNSVILNLVSHIKQKTASAYRESRSCEAACIFINTIKRWFNGSMFWRFVKSPEKTSVYWEESCFYKVAQKAADVLLASIRKFFYVFHDALNVSVTGFATVRIIDRLMAVICLFIFVSTIIPHDRWRNHYSTIIIAFIAVIYLFKAATDREYHLDLRKLDFALIIFVLSALLSAFTSIARANSIRTLVLHIVPILLSFIMVLSIKTKKEMDAVLFSIIAAVTIASLYGIWQYINHVPVDPLLVDISMGKKGVGRIFSTMENPNNYAILLLLTIPLYLAAFFNAKSVNLKVVVALLTLLSAVNLALTYSRACYVGFLVAVLVFALLKNGKYIPMLILVGLAALPLLPRSIIDRMRNLSSDTSYLYRLEIWKGAFRLLKDYWLTGIGPGTEPFMKLFLSYSSATPPAHSHMFPLQLGLEFGAPGLLSFIWFMGRTFKKGLKRIFTPNGDAYLKNVAIACISSLAGMFTVGIVEYIWFYPRILNQFWINVGLLTVALNMNAGKESAYYAQE